MLADHVRLGVTAVRRVITRWFPVLDRHRGARQFIKFCLVGASNVAVYFTIYLLLTRGLRWHFLAGSILSFLVVVTWSFYWTRRWTFRVGGRDSQDHYRRFIVTNIVSGVGSNIALFILVEQFGWHDIAANIVTIGFTTIWNFTVTKFWAFRP